eukprot:14826008-Alexandrium_andersonii.AAC.1
MDATKPVRGGLTFQIAAAASSQCVSCERHGRPRSSWREMTAFEASLPSAAGLTSQRTFQLQTPISSMLHPTERSARQSDSKAWSATSSRREMCLGA